MRSIVIVGFSTAGLAAAETLRREGFSGDLTVVSGESHWPYDRPPLTKSFLRNEQRVEHLELRPRSCYEGLGARILRGVDAVDLDVEGRRVTVSNGDVLAGDGILIATGVRARQLPLARGLRGVHTIRNVEDVAALRAEISVFDGPARVVVIGAGVLGCEVASTTRKLGHEVTVVDEADLPSVRQFGPWVAQRMAEVHEARGVRLLMGRRVCGVQADDTGRATSIELDTGLRLEADLIVLAIGSVPATEWLAASGLPMSNGLDGDQYCQAAPGIVTAGDVGSWINGAGARVRAEDKTNAVTHGMAAARRLLGSGKPYDPVSFFWTEQFDVLVQAYGRCSDADLVQLVSCDAERGSFSAILGKAGKVTGAVAWNEPVALRKLRRVVDEGVQWRAALRDLECRTSSPTLM